MKINSNIKYLNWKTIYFNYKYLPFNQFIKFPFFISLNVKFRKAKGSVKISGKIKTGMIKIGSSEIGLFHKSSNNTIWENNGSIVFRGQALIKYGSKIIIGTKGILDLGSKFRISSASAIICYKKITIGDNCRISWETQIIDTDFHPILNNYGKIINPNKEIIIADNCWIGNRCNINKGTKLAKNTIVASMSLTNKANSQENVIIAGIPAMVIKTGVRWSGNSLN